MTALDSAELMALYHDTAKNSEEIKELKQRIERLEAQLRVVLERLSYYQQITDSRLRKIENEVKK